MKNNHRQIALVVDDEIDNLQIMAQMLEFEGIEVHTAKSGDYALEMLKSITPDFMLVDINMPRMNGWALLDHLRANPRLARIPVIAVTAHALINDRDKILDYGFDGYIPKPVDLRHLVANINAWINHRAAA